MKDLLGWFCVGFAFFFVAGGIVGWLNRVPPDQAIDLVAVRHIALTANDNNELVLTYTCKDHDYFRLNIDEHDALIPDQSLLEHPIIPRPLSFENFETIFVAATGWELRNVVASATGLSITSRQKVALLLGSVSGFYAGRWLFSTRLPSCDSKEILSRLQGAEYWNKLKHEKCKQLCLRFRLLFPPTDDEPLVLNTDPIRKAATSLPNVKDRSTILGYLNWLDKVFQTATSEKSEFGKYDFSHIVGGIPYLLQALEENPAVLKAAFPSRRTPVLRFTLNEDPEVIKREVEGGIVILHFETNDFNQMNRSAFYGVEIITACLILGFLLSAIVAALFLMTKRVVRAKGLQKATVQRHSRSKS